MNSDKSAFLAIVRLGTGRPAYMLPEELNWEEIQRLANEHGVSAIIVDGIERLPENKRPAKTFLLQLIGEVLHSYEQRYELYRRAIAEMAAWHNAHGYKMMVLKGYACAMNWTKPEHRPCGDIDIWQFGNQKEIDALMVKEKSLKIDSIMQLKMNCFSITLLNFIIIL